jgi:hypothetical protein
VRAEQFENLLGGERAPPGAVPSLAGDLGDEHAVSIRSRTILTHLFRVEHGYAKGKVNSENRSCPIRRVLKFRHPAFSVRDMDTGVMAPA